MPRCMLQMDIKKTYDSVDWLVLKQIMGEIGFPRRFIRCIMKVVTTVTYQFSINGQSNISMKAATGLRQGDPISPLLFVIVMEYLHMKMGEFKKCPDFKFYSKCEKLELIDLSFADDLLLFSREDAKFVQMMMTKFNSFLKSKGLTVNRAKCKTYYGGMDISEKNQIVNMNGFIKGQFPFRYLGIPLMSRKLSSHHWLELCEKIRGRLRHWSSHLLSYTGRLQLIKSTIFGIANYWMQCIPLSKCVIKKVEFMYNIFFWINKDVKTGKSSIAWDIVCAPQQKDGLNIINMYA